jgi:hypothetical protein
VRAVADYCEYVSDACDAAGTGFLIAGAGTLNGAVAAAGIALYKAGTIAGSISDAVNIGVDLYEGRYKSAFVRFGNSVITIPLVNKIRKMPNNADLYIKKAVDKLTDAYGNKIIESLMSR